jgi:hypothetical protein
MPYQVGTFKAKVKDYGIGETAKSDPQVFLVMDVDFAGDVKGMTWYGNFNGGAKFHTFKALAAVGFYSDDPSVLIDGPDSGAIEIGAEASVVVEEVDKVKDGVVTGRVHKISWVNKIGGVGQVKRAEPSSMKAKFAKMNLAGDLAKFKAENPGLMVKRDDSDIPFEV